MDGPGLVPRALPFGAKVEVPGHDVGPLLEHAALLTEHRNGGLQPSRLLREPVSRYPVGAESPPLVEVG